MANIEELKTVLKDTLENRGVLAQMKARMRAEVFHALDDQLVARPQLSNENMLINELIREYLEFNKYNYTSSVLMAESGQPRTPLDREFLTNELNIREGSNTSRLPLLYGVLSHFLEGKDLGSGTMAPKSSHFERPRTAHHAHTNSEGISELNSGGVYSGDPVILAGLTRR